MTPVATPLTAEERVRLDQLEAVVGRGIRTFLEVGQALAAINAERLYRETHPSFAAYANDIWSISRARAYQLIDAFTTAQTMKVVGVTVQHEREARKLKPVAQAIRGGETLEAALAVQPAPLPPEPPSPVVQPLRGRASVVIEESDDGQWAARIFLGGELLTVEPATNLTGAAWAAQKRIQAARQ